jgi:hypothetical protein
MDVYVRHAIASEWKVCSESNDSACFAGFWLRPEENVLAGTKTRGERISEIRQMMRGEDDYSSDCSRGIMGTDCSSFVGSPGAKCARWSP